MNIRNTRQGISMLVNKQQRDSLKAKRCMTSAEEATKQRRGKMGDRNKAPPP